MNRVVAAWNEASEPEAMAAMLACCGAKRWAEKMVASRPIGDIAELNAAADRAWAGMAEPDWLEAFACHPRIGERKAGNGSAQSQAWSTQEQSGAKDAREQVLGELAADNALYQERFGFTYIVCATGKSAEEMLSILKRRLGNDRDAELKEAAEQQRQIMQIRLGKWLAA
jgi:OHCU decarboxylase